MTAVSKIIDRIDHTASVQKAIWRGNMPYSIERAAKSAARINTKRKSEAPLFASAGLVDVISPEELKEKYENSNYQYSKKWIAAIEEERVKANNLILELINFYPDSWFTEKEEYRVRTFPEDIVYDLGYWKKYL